MEKKMIITASFDAESITPHIHWWSKKMLHTSLEVTHHSYRVMKDLLLPSSKFRQFDLRVVWNRFDDWIRHDDRLPEPEKYEKLERALNDMINAVNKASQHGPLYVAVFPVSTDGLSNTLYHFIVELNERWKVALEGISGVSVTDFRKAQQLYGIAEPYDYVKDVIAHRPFTQAYEAALGACLIRSIHTTNSHKFKVIVLDCDNTLWKGICGERGACVDITEPYKAIQQLMLTKMREGMLLVISSKNNEEDVWRVFDTHPDMILKKEHFVSWRINWNSKAENIQSMAAELNIALNSMIFIDDSPHECLEVMSLLPDVLTLKLPKASEQIPNFLSHVWALDKGIITEEDRKRTVLYQREKERKSYLRKAPDQYLSELKLEVHLDRATADMLPRLAQLSQRTNQFNSSIIRRNENELQEIFLKNNHDCWVVEVIDRFGTYGLTGMLLTEITGKKLRIETFILSCRVLGRGVDAAIIVSLKDFCKNHGLEHIHLLVYESPNNLAIQKFLIENNWTSVGLSGEYRIFSIDLALVPNSVPYIDSFFLKGLPSIMVSDHESIANVNVENRTAAASWEVYVANEQALLHRNQLIPLEKISLFQLIHHEPIQMINDGPVEVPQTEMERTVAKEMCEILGLREISVTQPIELDSTMHGLYYDFVSALYRKLNLILPLENLQGLPTVRAIAAYVESYCKEKVNYGG